MPIYYPFKKTYDINDKQLFIMIVHSHLCHLDWTLPHQHNAILEHHMLLEPTDRLTVLTDFDKLHKGRIYFKDGVLHYRQ